MTFVGVRCSCCKKTLPGTMFHGFENGSWRYRSSQCKKCTSRRARTFEANNPIKVMLRRARQRATRDRVPFAIGEDDIVIPETCPVLGIKLSYRGSDIMASPSLDRIVPALGYVKGNVAVISHRANSIKSNASASEVAAVAKWMQTLIPHCIANAAE